MATPGDVIVNPTQGDTIIFRKTGTETNGELLEFEMILEPAAAGTPRHIHPNSEERFQVLAGTIMAEVGDRELTAGEGEEVVVPKGTPHRWWNGSQQEARVVVAFSPASRMDAFLESLYGLAQDGKTNQDGVPSPLQLAVLAPAYSDVIYIASPPLFVQKILFGVLGPVARWLGYEADYPYPYAEQNTPASLSE